MKHKVLQLERLLCILGLPFLMCMIMQMIVGGDHFMSLIREWKGLAIFSFVSVMWHSTRELQTAFEDYIKNEKKRCLFIYLGYGGFALSVGIVIWKVMSF